MPEQTPAQPSLLDRIGAVVAQETANEQEPEKQLSRESNDESPETPESEEPEADEAAAPDEEADEAEAPGISTIEELAKSFGVEPDAFLSTVQVNDHEGKPVPLAQVVEAYRKHAADGTLPDTLIAKRSEYERKAAEVQVQGAHRVAALETMTGRLLQALKVQDNIDWDALERDDPLAYSVQRTKYNEQLQLADQSIRQLEAERQMNAQQEAVARAEWQRNESILLKRAQPELQDQAKFNAAAMDVAKTLAEAGFTSEKDPIMVDLLGDHRVFQVILDAARWRAAKKGIAAGATKGLKITKGIPALARRDAGQNSEKAFRAARSEMRKRGGDRESTIAVLERMNY